MEEPTKKDITKLKGKELNNYWRLRTSWLAGFEDSEERAKAEGLYPAPPGVDLSFLDEWMDGLTEQEISRVKAGIVLPELEEWECTLFGVENGIKFTPQKGNLPNRFWRTMQYLLTGSKWRNITK